MQAAPLRFVAALLWPLSVWTSFAHLEEHPADDYVERTGPIAATAVAFWISAIGFAMLWWAGHAGALATIETESGSQVVRIVDRSGQIAESVLGLFLPLIYIVGFWMFTARAEKYRV